MFKKLKSILNQKINSSKGAISIMMVIFLLTLSAAFAMLIDLSSIMFGMKEIQSKMDIAGMNALYNVVDYRYLRDETLGLTNGESITSSGTTSFAGTTSTYATLIRNKYNDELRSIKYPGSNPKIEKSRVSFEYSKFGVGYNSSSSSAKSKPQVVLESIVSYEVSASNLVDSITRNLVKRVWSTYDAKDFTVTISDTGQDGKSKVMLHSITRIILE